MMDLYTPQPGLWRTFLARVYGLAVRLRLKLHQIPRRRPRRLPARVVCVGGLTVGGSGKTPLVMAIAREAARRGWRPAVVSRGYMGKNAPQPAVVSDGRKVHLGPGQAGDEPYLLAQNLPGAPVIVGRRRFLAGRAAVVRYDADLVIMDDGFQHLDMGRDVNLALLDGVAPFGNGRLLPAGPLREPPDQVQRADAVVLTRCPNPDPPGKAEVEQRLDGQPIFMTDHQPQALVDLETGQRLAAEHLRGRTVIGFCGLARPEVFLKTLQDLGAVVPAFVRWPDHHHPNDDDLKLIQGKAREVGASEAVTTAKDAVKLAGRLADYRPRVWVLEVAPVFLKDEEAFWDLVLPETSRHAR